MNKCEADGPGIVKRILTRDEAGIALDALTARTAERHIDNPVHPGDVGWHLRFDATELADCLWLWEADGVPVPTVHHIRVIRTTSAIT